MVTGQNYAFVQHNWLTFAGLFHFRVARYATGCRSGTVNVGVYQTEFQRCRRTQNLFRTRSVLNTAVQQRYGQHPDAEPPAPPRQVGLRLRRILMFCCTAYSRASLRRASLITARSWLLPRLLITRSGWRLLRYAMASSRALASRKVMLRP